MEESSEEEPAPSKSQQDGSQRKTSNDEETTSLHAGEQDTDSKSQSNLSKLKLPFPWKLHQLLDDMEAEGSEDIASWLPDGKSFRVNKPEDFGKQVMSKYFRQTKFSSFIRQLYIYGFSKIDSGPGLGGYYHPKFVRGERSAALTLGRNKFGDRRCKQQWSTQLDERKATPQQNFSACGMSNLPDNVFPTRSFSFSPNMAHDTNATPGSASEMLARAAGLAQSVGSPFAAASGGGGGQTSSSSMAALAQHLFQRRQQQQLEINRLTQSTQRETSAAEKGDHHAHVTSLAALLPQVPSGTAAGRREPGDFRMEPSKYNDQANSQIARIEADENGGRTSSFTSTSPMHYKAPQTADEPKQSGTTRRGTSSSVQAATESTTSASSATEPFEINLEPRTIEEMSKKLPPNANMEK